MCNIGNVGAAALAAMPAITRLDLCGACGLAGHALKRNDACCAVLMHAGNSIGDDGVKALTTNTSLTFLGLYRQYPPPFPLLQRKPAL